MENTTPMLKQYNEIKHQHPGTLLFFRLGDFYEMFYEDAIIGARELEITLTARNKERGTPVPMCGVPYHSASNYISKLVRKGYRVAICDQLETASKGIKLVKRDVVRIITPGTTVDSQLLESKENCYLAAITGNKDTLAVAFVDVSTGEFITTQTSGENSWSRLVEEIESFSPKEIIYPQSLSSLFGTTNSSQNTPTIFAGAVITGLEDWQFEYDRSRELLCSHFKVASLDGFGLEKKSVAISASGAILNYVRDTQKEAAAHINNIAYFEPADYMILDGATIRNLELVAAIEGSKSNTLLGVLDQTETSMGARLLKQWLLRPSIKLGELNTRLDTVAEVRRNTIMRDRVRQQLGKIQDLERLLGRISLGTANPRDLLSLKSSLEIIPEVKLLLEQATSSLLEVLREDLDELSDISNLIKEAITDEPPANLSDGGVFREGYHKELDELRSIRQNAQSFIAAIEIRERERIGISSLKVRFNNVFGYFIEVSKTNLKLVPAEYERKQTLVNAERFTTPELKELETKVLGAEEEILRIEQDLFQQLRQQIASQTTRIQRTAHILAIIDVLFNFAEVAAKKNYCRPTLNEADEIILKDSRHPVVETQGERFIPNDLYINNTTHRLLIITGPNMGGKSVYLRQTALISIMAQIGCFVPATEAQLAIVDRVFTRVGASDNLARGRSTFMVEMTETAYILNTATPRSLILLDEIGRGTATFDGLSLAWAIAEYLHDNAKHAAKTIFATHYHEMTELAKLLPGVRNFQMALKEQGGQIVFLRRLIEGSTSKSYGIEVARIAGLPTQVIERAREILGNLEANELDVTGKPKLARHLPSRGNNWKQQPSLFDLANESVLQILRELPLEQISPEEALRHLAELKRQLL
ncbi:MAG: DNA mismatch repair protein MutS [Acidobacteria bacterium]|nr:DNA mismatch repair protein MutS [Acidobacteriota bacterium]